MEQGHWETAETLRASSVTPRVGDGRLARGRWAVAAATVRHMFALSLPTGSWAVFVGTFFLGESVILASAALAAQGSWSVWAVAGWAFAGTVLSDAVWFSAAGRGVRGLRGDPGRAERLDRHVARLDRWTGQRPHRALLFVKFVYGTRILSISYLSVRGVPLRRFVTFDAAGTLIWLAVIVPLGYLGGRGLSGMGVDLAGLERGLVGLIAVGVLARAVVLWWRRR